MGNIDSDNLFQKLLKIGNFPKPNNLPEVKNGVTYIVHGVDRGYQLFRRYVDGDSRKGLCISRIIPKRVEEKYGIKGSRWLAESVGNGYLDPNQPTLLGNEILQFFKANGEGSMAFLDGLEYLLMKNNFETVSRAVVDTAYEEAALNKGIFAMAVDPSALDKTTLAILERELDSI